MTAPSFLISLDFDGTLCLGGEQTAVDPVIHGELRAWMESGAHWVINTGRSLPHAMEGLVGARFEDRPQFMITRERDIHCLNQVGRWVPFGDWNARAEEAQRVLFKKARRVFKEVQAFLAAHTLAEFISLPEDPAGIIASNTEEMVEICAFIDPLLAGVPGLRYERNSIYLRFSHAAYSKGSALRHLAESLGLLPTAVFAAGDNYNDATMLDPAIAAHLACPSNALPEVRAHVCERGGYCSDLPGAAGVADALSRLRTALAGRGK